MEEQEELQVFVVLLHFQRFLLQNVINWPSSYFFWELPSNKYFPLGKDEFPNGNSIRIRKESVETPIELGENTVSIAR